MAQLQLFADPAPLFDAVEADPQPDPPPQPASTPAPAPTGPQPKPGTWPGRAQAKAALEAHLTKMGYPYVVVDEARKAIFAESSISSVDFLLYSEAGANLLVMVRGRKQMRREHYATMREWESIFGEDFRAVHIWPHAAGEWYVTYIGGSRETVLLADAL